MINTAVNQHWLPSLPSLPSRAQVSPLISDKNCQVLVYVTFTLLSWYYINVDSLDGDYPSIQGGMIWWRYYHLEFWIKLDGKYWWYNRLLIVSVLEAQQRLFLCPDKHYVVCGPWLVASHRIEIIERHYEGPVIITHYWLPLWHYICCVFCPVLENKKMSAGWTISCLTPWPLSSLLSPLCSLVSAQSQVGSRTVNSQHGALSAPHLHRTSPPPYSHQQRHGQYCELKI